MLNEGPLGLWPVHVGMTMISRTLIIVSQEVMDVGHVARVIEKICVGLVNYEREERRMWNSEQAIALLVGVWATVQMGLWFGSELKQARARRRR